MARQQHDAPSGGLPAAVKTTLAAMNETYRELVAAIHDEPDLMAALAAIDALTDALANLVAATAVVRASIVARLWATRPCEIQSLGQFAARLGVSKTRVAQLLRKARD